MFFTPFLLLVSKHIPVHVCFVSAASLLYLHYTFWPFLNPQLPVLRFTSLVFKKFHFLMQENSILVKWISSSGTIFLPQTNSKDPSILVLRLRFGQWRLNAEDLCLKWAKMFRFMFICNPIAGIDVELLFLFYILPGCSAAIVHPDLHLHRDVQHVAPLRALRVSPMG